MVHIFSHCILSKLFGTLVFLENRIIGAFAFIVRSILHPNPPLLAPIKDHFEKELPPRFDSHLL